MQKRKWGGVEFYKHAKPPPPARERRFKFLLFKEIVGKKNWFDMVEVEMTGISFHDAVAKLSEIHPNHGVVEHLGGLWRDFGFIDNKGEANDRADQREG